MARLDLGFSSADRQALAATKAFALRVASGDDASCLNLYQPQQPRVLGLPESLIHRGGFAWSKSAATTSEEIANPWLLLDKPPADSAPGDAVVPIVLDEATAMYSLHLGGVGAKYTIDDGRGEPLETEVVGLLAGSVLQGSVLMSQRDFLKYFPDAGGYRFFLIDAPAADEAQCSGGARKDARRLWLRRRAGRRAIGRILLGAEHLSVDVSKPGRPGIIARHLRPRRRAIAQRRRTSLRAGIAARRRIPPRSSPA